MNESNACALCLQKNTLRESHIMPKFVGKWIKETGTGYLASAEDGSKRVQDITKSYLLCDNCEEKFSKLEKYFAERVFFPFHNDKIRTFEYDKNLVEFIISLSWRTLKTTGHNFKEKVPNSHLNSFVDEAEICWREFLNGERESVNQYENHVFFLDGLADGQGSAVDPKFHWYAFRSVDCTIVDNVKRVFVYVMLPGMAFVTTIYPKTLEGWSGTVIKENGKISSEQSITDGGFLQFLSERASLVMYSSRGPTPDVAAQRLARVVERDPEKFLESDTFRSMIKERDLRRKKKMKNMPESVIALVEGVIRHANGNHLLTNAENQSNRWRMGQIADEIANLSKEHADELDKIIRAVIKKSEIRQQDEQHTLETDFLCITFMVTRNATKEQQQAKIGKEIEKLRRQTDDKIPLAVFSSNSPEHDFESGFSFPKCAWGR